MIAFWLMMAVLTGVVVVQLTYIVLGLVRPQSIHHNHTHSLFEPGGE